MDIMLSRLKKKVRHYLIPHQSNNYKAHALHNGPVIFYIFLLIFLQTGNGFIKHQFPDVLGYATDITTEKILVLVNEKRREADLPELKMSQELSVAATQKAADMFTKNYWAHVSPTGVTPWVFINGAGYNYVYAGENLARSFDNAQQVVDAWMESPTHRSNILKREYTDIGLAVMNGKLNGEETTLVVQEFGAKTVADNPADKTELDRRAEVVPAISSVPYIAGSNASQDLSRESTNVFLPWKNTKSFSVLLVEFLLIVLLIDSVYIWRHRIFRISGHSMAHIIFLAALLGAMWATGMGVIL